MAAGGVRADVRRPHFLAVAMRVHFVAHHERNRAAGVSGATQSLGDALAKQGCEVSYFHFDDAFPTATGSELSRMIRFPWRVASHLSRMGRDVDVVDATTGDAWVWGMRRGRSRTTLVTRAHGLEHVADADIRARAARGEMDLSAKYPIYHGGYRLWEVRRSLATSDATIFLNEIDRRFAVDRLSIAREATFVVPNGAPDALLDRMVEAPVPHSARLSLVFIGSWIPRKGTVAIVGATKLLVERGIPFTLAVLGAGRRAEEVRGAFGEDVRPFVTIESGYVPADLPSLVKGGHVLLHPSWTEGFSLGLVEGMALGLAPIATRSGGAPSVISDGESGVLLPDETPESLANAVERLASDPALVMQLRRGARRRALEFRWSDIAARTLEVYRQGMAMRREHLDS
jgi:glycosyltransferase involved in cell wall biosynthesis